ncbi:sialate O-acetylesterase [Agrilactobacillus fermenti]|uniref:sialate O-acetylesterase n=1 Tax=Agrilactobacillus fermenti TaxID=2586909 RepID=UPI003A5BE31B
MNEQTLTNQLASLQANVAALQAYIKGAAPKQRDATKKFGIISAGQSNIDGRVPIAELPSDIKLPMTNCHYCSNYSAGHEQGQFSPALSQADLSSDRWGFDLVTYHYLTTLAKQEIYVMKWSEGGTSIDATGDNVHHWTVDYEALPDIDASLLKHFDDLVRQCLSAAKHQIEVRAMLWHQGESDRRSYSETAADNYYRNLKTVFAYCRGIVGNVTLPIFCGTVSHTSGQYDATVDAAIRQIAKEDPNVHCVDMSGGHLLDDFHFNRDSSVYFGQEIYNAFVDNGLVQGKKVATKRPW